MSRFDVGLRDGGDEAHAAPPTPIPSPIMRPVLFLLALVGLGLAGCATADQMMRDATAGAATGSMGIVTTTHASWTTTAGDLRGRAGRFAFDCPANSGRTGGTVWGTGPYTDDSSVCTAGVHAGTLGFGGGRVVVEMRPGQTTYGGSARNGVTAADYGEWSGSFVVVQ